MTALDSFPQGPHRKDGLASTGEAAAGIFAKLIERHHNQGIDAEAARARAKDQAEQIVRTLNQADMLRSIDHAAWGDDLTEAVTAYRIAWFQEIAGRHHWPERR